MSGWQNGQSLKWLVDKMFWRQWGNQLLMRIFHPINRLVFSRNLWLILLSKIWLLLNLAKPAKISKILRNPNFSLFFSKFSGSKVISNFIIFHWIKTVKHVWDPCCHLLVETGRNGQKQAESGRNGQKLAETGRNWQKLAETSRNWQNLAETGRKWQNLAETRRNGQKLA